MILELTDNEILDFLMTSEFEEDYKPEELKYLLYKFRYFHRLLHSKYDLVKHNSESESKKLTELSNGKDTKINQMLIEIANLQNQISSLKGRRLSMRERISGKIIYNNENK
jgi:predicted metal-dependent peptidase